MSVYQSTSPQLHPFSPLALCSLLITLAEQADKAGFRGSASRLVTAAYAVLDDEIPGQVA